ncbi:G patch domain-containing protein 1 [Ceratina calcarata]|uniref:G patch domain-containing protein 1 n=1 Tax=Ceratina calcarata TaxID=156304 RepID=A0AAJ7J6X1_9HYME|nr:G patch domain-containing protein 1 [Ceratina calcarata]
MVDSDDENYVTFGVPLDPIDEDNVPKKKPMTIEDQCAYDAQGRRRFHGAFTGGFSAGYFNTVGTRDGWRPQQFKSSRSSKAENISQHPEDFMDEEDTSEFGIAPKGIRATEDYVDRGQRGTKRNRVTRDNTGPIPGVPVLKELLTPVRETVGIMLLKKMGWRPGQGVGSRLTKKEKAKIKRRNDRTKLMQKRSRKASTESSSEDSEDDYGNLTFAPDDYEPFRCNPKDNYFGIGYTGLDRRTILSGHVNLFDTPAFSVQDKNKKLSIHGQAFGVGAFEADDDDIYERDDMSRYDFSLGPERKTKTRWSNSGSSKNSTDCLEGFARAKHQLERKKVFSPPELPKNFVPVHAVRKSRFYPPIENVPHATENGKRKDLTAADRARILEDTPTIKKPSENHPNSVPSVASNIITKTLNLHGRQQTEERQREENLRAKAAVSWMDKLNVQSFVKGGIEGSSKDSDGSLKKLEEFMDSSSVKTVTDKSISEEENSMKKTTAKSFFSDPDKQRRFEQYLVFVKDGEKNKLESIQPLSMTEWDREHERTEFEQAARLFEHPSNDYVANKFTHASESTSLDVSAKQSQEDEMKQAVRMKMFGKLTRECIEWKPASIVCKRFNIPEPKGGCAQPEKKSAKFSIFDSLELSNSTKFSRATDTESRQINEPRLLKEKSDDISLDVNKDVSFSNQTFEPVSEKMKNFGASYEKVFGKEVQETASRVFDNKRESEDKSNTDTITESMDNQDQGTSSQTKKTVSKSQSEEKKDLFKAIFLSSSEESDSEPEETIDSEVVKSVLIGKVPAEVNVNRNTSPPRGIFAKVDLDSLLAGPKSNIETNEESNKEKDVNTKNSDSAVETKLSSDQADIEEVQMLPDMYGPVLPSRLLKTENTTGETSSSEPMKPVFRSVVVPKPKTDSKVLGVWVERKKEKKSKKEKKKHKHKEHKSSKHKRKSKKGKRGS